MNLSPEQNKDKAKRCRNIMELLLFKLLFYSQGGIEKWMCINNCAGRTEQKRTCLFNYKVFLPTMAFVVVNCQEQDKCSLFCFWRGDLTFLIIWHRSDWQNGSQVYFLHQFSLYQFFLYHEEVSQRYFNLTCNVILEKLNSLVWRLVCTVNVQLTHLLQLGLHCR